MKVITPLILTLSILLVPVSINPATGTSIPALREISYYPQNYAWLQFWSNWPQVKNQVDDDLDKIQALGANTVRIFLHPSVFGYPQPTPEYLGYFEEVLDLVEAHNLKAHVNLFDCWWSWQDVSGSQTWLAAIVQPYQNDPRIALWELQNEVPLYDQANQKNQVVHDWVQVMLPYLKQQTGGTPVTVSVSNVEWLDDVKDLTSPDTPDIYSLHWYPRSDVSWTTPFPSVIDRARALIGEAELLLGEFGYNTYTLSEASQANLYRDVLYYAHQKGIVHLGAWTLNDFPVGTTQCDENTPASDIERYYGLHRLDGSPKPAAIILKRAFEGNFPRSPSPPVVLNPSFEDLNPNSGQMDNWWPWDQYWSGQSTFVQDRTTGHTGQCSAKVQGANGTVVGLYQAPALPVDPDCHYSLQGYLKTQDLDGWAQIVLSWFDSDENWLGDTRSPVMTDPNVSQWTRVSIVKATPPVNSAHVQVFAQMASSNSDSYVWFDDMTFVPCCPVYLPLVFGTEELPMHFPLCADSLHK